MSEQKRLDRPPKELTQILAEIAPGEGFKFYERVAREIDALYPSRLDRTKLHDWGSPKGLPSGWRGRILKSSSGKRQDRPDREKIGKIFTWVIQDAISPKEAIGQILALIPDIEEWKQLCIEFSEELTHVNTLLELAEYDIEEAKKQGYEEGQKQDFIFQRGYKAGEKQERERIQADLKPLIAEALDISDWSFVQEYVNALKEEK